MAFFKFRQRGPAEPGSSRKADAAASGSSAETIESLRRRARHRLIGAVVLVGIAVIGFPLLFDTEPRPEAINAPITIPDRESAPPLAVPAPAPAPDPVPAAASLGEREEVLPPASSASAGPVQEAPDEDAQAAAAAADAAAAEAAARARQREQAEAEARARQEAEARTRARQEEQARLKREAEAEARARREAAQREAERARAALEGRSPAPAPAQATADSGRFIVQIGAFADEGAAREVRQKAERTGLKTYVQVVDTKAGKRTRVRVGPFATRAEADKAAETLKKAGLSGAVFSL